MTAPGADEGLAMVEVSPGQPQPSGSVPPPEAVPGGEKPSGLANPAAAVRGVGAGCLVMEGIVLLLAIQPIRQLGTLPGLGVVVMLILAVLCVGLAGMLRRSWAWHTATGLQVVVLAGGVFQWGIAAIGVIFMMLWLYALHVRRSVVG